ncbi:MAG TPA: prepilin-type N-terminal cleavage/methylation domain-containing protein [Gemmatimonadales bacterium]|nr:prepilin-type N-terminal cleavage/methylation domain-containing protein [Gemmatimonadales bacterium]
MTGRRGFTLLELIVVAVVLGFLASIAIGQFANAKEKTYIAVMKADLRNLITAEVLFSTDSLRFTPVIGSGGLTYHVTTGNTTPSIVLTGDGFTARIGNSNTSRTCAVYMGSTALAPATNEGEPACR